MAIGRTRQGRLTWAERVDQHLMAGKPPEDAMARTLVDALNQYGRHDRFCSAAHPDKPGPCDCGYDEARDLWRGNG